MSHPLDAEMLDIAERFFAAIDRGDFDAVRSLYAHDAVVWHNTDNIAQPAEENVRALAAAKKFIAGFDDVRRTATAHGFVQQHVLRGHASTGEEIRVPACLVFTVVDGSITRLDEYFDTAQISALLAPS
jgi:ketosteroid isomerase-like protein